MLGANGSPDEFGKWGNIILEKKKDLTPEQEAQLKAAKERLAKKNGAAAKEKAPAKKKAVTKEKAPKKEPVERDEPKQTVSTGGKKSVKGLRIGAIILWVLAIAAEVGAFFAFRYAYANGNFTLDQLEMQLLVGALVLDAIFCIVAAQLWKKANRIKPCLADSKFVRTVWHQLGVIMVLICFLPIGIFLAVKSDKMDKKTKTIVLALCAALFVGATATSIDYQQPSDEEVAQLQQQAIEENADGVVYWTRFGKSYHFDRDCSYLKNTKEENLFSGSLDDAFAANRWDACDRCAGGGEEKLAPDDAAELPEEEPAA